MPFTRALWSRLKLQRATMFFACASTLSEGGPSSTPCCASNRVSARRRQFSHHCLFANRLVRRRDSTISCGALSGAPAANGGWGSYSIASWMRIPASGP